MSAHGISPTWFGNTKFGEPLVFSPEIIHAIFVNCNIDFLGDVFATINLGVVCEIDKNNAETFITMNVNCDTTFVGDVNPIISFNMGVVAVASGP